MARRRGGGGGGAGFFDTGGAGFFDTGGGGGGLGAGGFDTGGAGGRVGADVEAAARAVDGGAEDGGAEGGDDRGTGASLAAWTGVTDAAAAVAWLALPAGLMLPQPATARAASTVASKTLRISPDLLSSGH